MGLSRWSQRRSGLARGRPREAPLLLSEGLQRCFGGNQFGQGLCHGGHLQVMSRRLRMYGLGSRDYDFGDEGF
jgi:hypothetical protein